MADNEILNTLGLNIAFDEYDPAVLDFITSRSFEFWTEASEVTIRRLRDTLMLAITENWDGMTLADEIADRVFGDAFTGDFSRARRIARTESTIATNSAFQLAYEQSGVVKSKLWLTNEDNKVRPSHTACQQQGEIPLDKPFINGLMYPGDPNGAVKELVNCRCVLAPVTKTARELELEDLVNEY